MANSQDILLTYKADTGDVTRSLEEVSSGIKKLDAQVGNTNATVDGGMQKLDQMTGGMITSFRGMRAGLKNAVLGMKTLKGAIASTGVGLLVVAIGSLALWFTKTKKGAEALEIATAVLEVAMSALVDTVMLLATELMDAFNDPIVPVENLDSAITDALDKETAIQKFGGWLKTYIIDSVELLLSGFGFLGTALKELFNRNFTEAMEAGKKGLAVIGQGILKLTPLGAVLGAVGDTVETVTEKIAAATKSMAGLTQAAINLRQAQRDLDIQFAEGRAKIKEYNLTAEDTTKTIEERVSAAQSAMEIEKGLMSQRIANATEELRIQQGTMALSENLEEDLETEKQLIVALSNIKMESFEMQTTLNNKVNGLIREGIALEAQAAAAIAERLQNEFDALDEYDAVFSTAQEKEVEAVAKKYDALLDLAALYGYDEQALIDAQNAEVEAINQEHLNALGAQEDAADAKTQEAKQKRRQAFLDTAKSSLDALSALNDAFTGDSEREQKKGFERSKKIQIAQALIGTYESATSAFGSLASIPIVGPALGAVAAAGAVVAGLANVKKIKGTTFSGGGGNQSNSYSGIGDTGSAASTPTSPQLDLSFLGGGAGQSGFRTYVIASEVSNSQQANQKINDQAALVG
tara:strand:- start:835 stop:2742 length:1908 start_codon:yes stop_codon:yes gene_type:complete